MYLPEIDLFISLVKTTLSINLQTYFKLIIKLLWKLRFTLVDSKVHKENFKFLGAVVKVTL